MSSADRRDLPYRDGLGAVLAPHLARRDRASARAQEIPSADLPAEVRRELDELAARLAAAPETALDVARAEEVLDAYEKRLDDAAWLVEEMRALRAATRRRGRLLRVGILAAAVVGGLGYAAVRRVEARRHDAARALALQDCRAGLACGAYGSCGVRELEDPSPTFICVATSNEDCAASTWCSHVGLCALRDGGCRATAPDHCRRSERCERDGYCTLDPTEGQCRPTAEDCRAGPPCRREGRCSLVGGECAAAGPLDCAQRPDCPGPADCAVQNGRCQPCRLSELCRHDGLCTANGERCVAANEADCAPSVVCAKSCRCTADDGECIATVPAPKVRCKGCAPCPW